MDAPIRCCVCHEVIGVYERVVMFGDHDRRITSLAWEGFPVPGDVELAHYDCAPAALEEENEMAAARGPERQLSGL